MASCSPLLSVSGRAVHRSLAFPAHFTFHGCAPSCPGRPSGLLQGAGCPPRGVSGPRGCCCAHPPVTVACAGGGPLRSGACTSSVVLPSLDGVTGSGTLPPSPPTGEGSVPVPPHPAALPAGLGGGLVQFLVGVSGSLDESRPFSRRRSRPGWGVGGCPHARGSTTTRGPFRSPVPCTQVPGLGVFQDDPGRGPVAADAHTRRVFEVGLLHTRGYRAPCPVAWAPGARMRTPAARQARREGPVAGANCSCAPPIEELIHFRVL